MAKIFIVNGTRCVGKTTFEHLVSDIAAEQGIAIAIHSTIDYIKEIAKNIGWDGSKNPEDRRFLSDLKDTLTRWKDLPYKKISEVIEQDSDFVDAIFIDCREPEEIKRFVEDYNATTILIQRGPIIFIGNHADDEVGKYNYDILIDNNRGLTELKEEAKIFVETFLSE